MLEAKVPGQRQIRVDGDSVFTRIPNGVFQYELLPFFSHPKELIVLRCINRHHYENFNERSEGIIKHFDEMNEELKESLSDEMKIDAEIAL